MALIIVNVDYEECIGGEFKKFHRWAIFSQKEDFDLIPILMLPKRKGFKNGEK